MIVSESVRLDVPFAAAVARLANLAHDSTLLTASRHAYGEGLTSIRVGPVGAAPGLSKLVEVRYRDLVTRGDTAVLTLRWEASGARGGLFPAFDADITLTPDGDHATALRLDGAYRPPLGGFGAGLDRALLHRVAAATIADFIGRIADAILHPAASAAPTPGLATTERIACSPAQPPDMS
jgi:carbon monoxide dehydrogenase subunit G